MRNMILFGKDKGMDERMALPQVPDDWVDPEPKTDQGEPIFKDVDNPGKRSSFGYRPVFGKDKQYKYHALPTSCILVKENGDGKRMTEVWGLFYNGWTPGTSEDIPVGNCRSGATDNNIFPEERKGCLDGTILKSLGMKKKVMDDKDFLFFYQLIFPLCNTSRSGVMNDPRMSYYSRV